MTEEEAKTKWCSHVNIAAAHQDHLPSEVFTSRGDIGEEGPVTTNCIGSECMAWRILEEWETVVTGKSYKKIRPNKIGKNDGGLVPSGYCGLAGKP